MTDIPGWLPLCAFITGLILGVIGARYMDNPHA